MNPDAVNHHTVNHAALESVPEKIQVGRSDLIVLVGPPGSGKSTFAVRNFPEESIVSTDRLRQELSNNPSNQLVSKAAFAVATYIVSERLKRGLLTVYDANNFYIKDRANYSSLARKAGVESKMIVLDIPPSVCVERSIECGRVSERIARFRNGEFQKIKSDLLVEQLFDATYVLQDSDAAQIVLASGPNDNAVDLDESSSDSLSLDELRAYSSRGYRPTTESTVDQVYSVAGGSVLFSEADQSRSLYTHLDSHQIIDIEALSRRMGCTTDEAAVGEVATMILAERVKLNLVTAVRYPSGWNQYSLLMDAIAEFENEAGVSVENYCIAEADFANRGLKIVRSHLEERPLRVIGDVQGCLAAAVEHAAAVEQENQSRRAAGEQERIIVFVGDMADRGTRDAESVRYIVELVRSGKAVLIKGNHDENLLKILEGRGDGPRDAKATADHLRELCDDTELAQICDVIRNAPPEGQWQGIAVGHASPTHLLRPDEALSADGARLRTFGARSRQFIDGRVSVYAVGASVAHDPDMLVVAGHTHSGRPEIDFVSGTANLDASVELKGNLLALQFPELEFVATEEPDVLRNYELLGKPELVRGQALLEFIQYCERNNLVQTKQGQGVYQGLTLVTYSQITELGRLWDQYPALRNFRGLIVDSEGNVVFRPFRKSHKSGIEIPLEELEFVPDRLFEKANGTLANLYHWRGEWRVSTKFSFENEWTAAAERLLETCDLSALDPDKGYSFELILASDPHIVDYGGIDELVLLNILDKETGAFTNFENVQSVARELGVRAADDMTAQFSDMTIAEVYKAAQTPGVLVNTEGMMALYTDEEGREQLIKIKSGDYDDKKFVRDRFKWEDLIDLFDLNEGTFPEHEFARMCRMRPHSEIVRSALERRAEWLREASAKLLQETIDSLSPVIEKLQQYKMEFMSQSLAEDQAISRAIGRVLKEYSGRLPPAAEPIVDAFSHKSVLGLLREQLKGSNSSGDAKVQEAIKTRLKKVVAEETRRRGKCAYWVIPQEQ